MAWTPPRTWSNGEIPTGALFNTHLRDNLNVLYDPVRSMMPEPVMPVTGAPASVALAANNTTAHGGAIVVPNPITINKILYWVTGASGGAPSTVIIAIYDETGQSRLISASDAVGAATGLRIIDITNTVLEAGVYYVLVAHGVFSTSGKLIQRHTYDFSLGAHIANEPDLSGTLTIAAGVLPATFDPTALTTVAGALIPVLRFLGTAT